MEDDLEAIRQRRLQELQAKSRAPAAQDPAAAEEAQVAAQEAAIERILQQVLEPEARERLTRIRLSRPELWEQIARQLVGLAQSGRLVRRITDDDLRKILAGLPQDRDIKITRK